MCISYCVRLKLTMIIWWFASHELGWNWSVDLVTFEGVFMIKGDRRGEALRLNDSTAFLALRWSPPYHLNFTWFEMQLYCKNIFIWWLVEMIFTKFLCQLKFYQLVIKWAYIVAQVILGRIVSMHNNWTLLINLNKLVALIRLQDVS